MNTWTSFNLYFHRKRSGSSSVTVWSQKHLFTQDPVDWFCLQSICVSLLQTVCVWSSWFRLLSVQARALLEIKQKCFTVGWHLPEQQEQNQEVKTGGEDVTGTGGAVTANQMRCSSTCWTDRWCGHREVSGAADFDSCPLICLLTGEAGASLWTSTSHQTDMTEHTVNIHIHV